jgi:hypothetical protein
MVCESCANYDRKFQAEEYASNTVVFILPLSHFSFVSFCRTNRNSRLPPLPLLCVRMGLAASMFHLSGKEGGVIFGLSSCVSLWDLEPDLDDTSYFIVPDVGCADQLQCRVVGIGAPRATFNVF